MRNAKYSFAVAGIVALSSLGLALPASAKVAKPTVVVTGSTPSEAPARGGKVVVDATVTGATTCTVTTYPKLTPVVTNCVKPIKLKVTANTGQRARSFNVKITATGKGGTTTKSTTLAQHAPVYVELFGDSILYQGGPSVAAALQTGNGDVIANVHAWPYTSICFWNQADRADGIPKMIAAHHPVAILLDFSGLLAFQCGNNGSQSTDGAFSFTANGLTQTTSAYTKVLRSIINAGVKHVTVVPMPTRDLTLTATSGTDEANLKKAIADGITALASAKATLLDVSPAITKVDGSYTKTLPCLPEELSTAGHCWGPLVDGTPSNYVRSDDGLHLCNVTWPKSGVAPAMGCPGYGYSSGAYRFGSYIATSMLAAITGG